jgi:hypothetical protein
MASGASISLVPIRLAWSSACLFALGVAAARLHGVPPL